MIKENTKYFGEVEIFTAGDLVKIKAGNEDLLSEYGS